MRIPIKMTFVLASAFMIALPSFAANQCADFFQGFYTSEQSLRIRSSSVFEQAQKSASLLSQQSQNRADLIQQARDAYQREFIEASESLKAQLKTLSEKLNKEQTASSIATQNHQKTVNRVASVQKRIEILSKSLNLFSRITGIGFSKSGRVSIKNLKKSKSQLSDLEFRLYSSKNDKDSAQFRIKRIVEAEKKSQAELAELSQKEQVTEQQIAARAEKMADELMKLSREQMPLAKEQIKSIVTEWLSNEVVAYKSLVELRSLMAEAICKGGYCIRTASQVLTDIQDAQAFVLNAQMAEAAESLARASNSPFAHLASANSTVQRNFVGQAQDTVNARVRELNQEMKDYEAAMVKVKKGQTVDPVQTAARDNMIYEYMDLAMDLSGLQTGISNFMFSAMNSLALINSSSQLESTARQIENVAHHVKVKNKEIAVLIEKADADMLSMIERAVAETLKEIGMQQPSLN